MVELSLVSLLILFLVLLFLLLSLFLYLMLKKYLNNKSSQKVNRIKEQARLEMFHYLQTGDTGSLEFEPSEEKFIALIELLSEYAHVLESPEVRERIRQFAKQHLTSFIRKELKQKRWSLRMNALYSIEDFHQDQFLADLHVLYRKKKTNHAEKAQIIKLFAMFNDPNLLRYIRETYQGLSDFSLLSIFSEMDHAKLDELLMDFQSMPKRIQYLLIDTIGKNQLMEYLPLLHQLLKQEDHEVTIRTLKAFALSGFPIEESLLAPFFESELGQIRMMAVRVAGVQRLEHVKGILISLLSDPIYNVRAEAAKALLRFKDGEDILQTVIKQSKDAFAKDMAREWLEKERGIYSY